jgi:Protein of unknown function (DUF1566).
MLYFLFLKFWAGPYESYTVVDQLNQNSFGSYTDWRIPTIKELASIVHFSIDGITLNTSFFPYMKLDSYWSTFSSYYSARCIDFSNGNDLSKEKSKKLFFIQFVVVNTQ